MNLNNTFDNITKDEILEYLRVCNSYWVWLALPSIAVELTYRYPIEFVAKWFNDDVELITRTPILDDRLTSVAFLDALVELGLEDATERNSNGSNNLDINNIVDKLATLSSFEVAINTWMVVCRDWLAVCYVDYIVEVLKKDSKLKPSVSIARIMIGALQKSFY